MLRVGTLQDTKYMILCYFYDTLVTYNLVRETPIAQTMVHKKDISTFVKSNRKL